MPILQNAKKALRASKHKAAINRPVRSRVRTMVEIAHSNPIASTLSQAFSALDKSVKRGLMHKNTAARVKSALSKKVGTPSAKTDSAKTAIKAPKTVAKPVAKSTVVNSAVKKSPTKKK